jgi:hypothetical protein
MEKGEKREKFFQEIHRKMEKKGIRGKEFFAFS